MSHQTILPADGDQVESHSILGFRSMMASDEACYTGNQHSTVQWADKLPDTMLERYAIAACSGDCNSFTKQLHVNAVRAARNEKMT